MVAVLAQLLADPAYEPAPQPKLRLVPPRVPVGYEIALRAWVNTPSGALRGYCVFADETGCEIHGQGNGLSPGERVIVKIDAQRGEFITAAARVVTAGPSRAFLRFEELPLDAWSALAAL